MQKIISAFLYAFQQGQAGSQKTIMVTFKKVHSVKRQSTESVIANRNWHLMTQQLLDRKEGISVLNAELLLCLFRAQSPARLEHGANFQGGQFNCIVCCVTEHGLTSAKLLRMSPSARRTSFVGTTPRG